MGRDAHQRVEDDDTLQGRTEGHHPAGTVVLLLLADKEEAHLGVVDHKLDLLLGTGGVERNGDSTDAPCAKVTLQILH